MMSNVLSLFNGCSCFQVALERVGIKYDKYYSSEIDKYANQITQKNFPDTIQLGDIHFVSGERLPKIDILCGGSPCQDLSIAGKRKGLKGGRSSLFWEYLRILKETNPRYFILENVASMKQADRDIITKEMGVEPIMINSALVSAQQRKRLFWTNIPVEQPEDKHIYLKDILESGFTERDKSLCITASYAKSDNLENYLKKKRKQLIFKKPIRIGQIGKGGQGDRIYSIEGKSVSLSALGGGRGAKTGLYLVNDEVRKLSPIECERLMGLEDSYTEGVSNTQRYKMCGNAFNSDVIAHILKGTK